MLTAVRATVLAGLLFTPIAAQGGAAQSVADRYALEFLGFRAGARLDELSRRLAANRYAVARQRPTLE
jgi:hypothetical protein